MTLKRYWIGVFVLGLLCGGVGFLLKNTLGWEGPLVQIVILVPGLAVLFYLWRRKADEKRAETEVNWRDTARLALFGSFAVLGIVMTQTTPQGSPPFFIGFVVFVIALIFIVPACIAHMNRHIPKRPRASQVRGDRWGALVTLQIALIGGLLDFIDILSLSGAQVGFAAACTGVLVGISVQAWDEWQAAR